MSTTKKSTGLRRHEVVGRILLAFVGAYAIAYTVSGALALTLPMAAHEGVTTAGLLTPPLAVLGAMLAFSARSIQRAALLTVAIAGVSQMVTGLLGAA